MRIVMLVAGVTIAGCDPVKNVPVDAADHLDAAELDALIDATVEIDAPACEPVLLTGGVPFEPQGWTVTQQAPATATNGPDYVRLETSTPVGANTGGQLLLVHADAFTANAPVRLQFELLVERTDPHNPFDAAVAIMARWSSSQLPAERDQMIYLDATTIGWANDVQVAPATIVDDAYHVIELAVDAANTVTVSVDGVAKLQRSNFVTDGTVAIGDQTNDRNVDSAIRIRSITKRCP